MNSNADSLRNKVDNIRKSQEKLENSFAEIRMELGALLTQDLPEGRW